jgi:hypothetical protein
MKLSIELEFGADPRLGRGHSNGAGHSRPPIWEGGTLQDAHQNTVGRWEITAGPAVGTKNEPDWHAIADAIIAQGFPNTSVQGGGAGPYFIRVIRRDLSVVAFGNPAETWTGAIYSDREAFESGDASEGKFQHDDTGLPSTITDPSTVAEAFAKTFGR